MINAHEAKRKTLINCECKGIMNSIERSIETVIRNGFYEAYIPLHQFGSTPSKQVVDAVCEELKSLGYKVDYIPEEPVKPGFHPSEQYNFNSYIKIDWHLYDEENEEAE